MRYFLHLAYNGTAYRGWQRQSNGRGVQEVLETKLSRMFHQSVTLHACGRTDAGVHAQQFFAHTTLPAAWDFDAVFRINQMLPPDIRVFDFLPVADDANAQLDVVDRTYDYYFHTESNPFLSSFSSYYDVSASGVGEMQNAAQLLTTYQDFKSFCKQPDRYRHTRCEVREVQLKKHPTVRYYRFRIRANRFLKSMVRLLVADLIRVGQGELSLVAFEQKLQRPQAIHTARYAYPQGLFLSHVRYPYLDLPTAAVLGCP